MKYLCDTNIVAEIMKRTPNAKVKQWMNKQDIIYVSVVTIEEIYYGLAYKNASRQLKWFDNFLKFRAEVLPITTSIAVRCGILRGQFRQKGITRTQADLLIAATAKEHNLVIVTRNVRDFSHCEIKILNPFKS